MFKTLNSKVTPFGGIALVHDQVSKAGIAKFIDNELGARGVTAGYKYSDILLSRIYTAFCGGSATEDIQYIRDNTLSLLKGISIPSPSTILRGEKELAVDCDFLKTKLGTENKVNINTKMNRFLLRSAIKLGQIDPERKDLVYDFDHQFIPTEKWDTTHSYKKERGYFPGVASIGNVPFAVEGRNGNCNVKTEQLATHKRNLTTLYKEGIKPAIARMDSGSYIKDVTDYFQEEDIKFFIRANHSESLLLTASKLTGWGNCKIGFQKYETNSLEYEFGKHTHRIIVYRRHKKSNQTNAFTGDNMNYMFIITNDRKISEEDAIIFYNKRGDSERVFDIQNNDFNWNAMPHGDLENNTVYLIIMAFAHILYRYLINIFAKVVDGITPSSRLKKFIFKIITIPVKLVKTGRRVFYRMATKNQKLIDWANTS